MSVFYELKIRFRFWIVAAGIIAAMLLFRIYQYKTILDLNLGLIEFGKASQVGVSLEAGSYDRTTELLSGTVYEGHRTRNKVLGYVAMSAGNPDAAVRFWQGGAVSVGELVTWARQAQVEGRVKDGQRFFDWALILEPNNSDVWTLKGMDFLDHRQFAEAIDAFERAVEANNYSGQYHVGSSTPHYLIGLTLYKDLNSSDIALIQSYFDVAESYGSFGSDSEGYWFYTWQSPILRRQGRYAEAVASATKALEYYPGGIDAQLWRALSEYDLTGDIDTAEKQFRMIIAQNPPYNYTYFYLGRLFLQEGDIFKARSVWNEGLTNLSGDSVLSTALQSLDE